MHSEALQKNMLMATEQNVDNVDELCHDLDFDHLGQVGGEIVDHLVNIDLTNYQYNIEKLFEQAQQLGYEIEDFEFTEEAKRKLERHAGCITLKAKHSELGRQVMLCNPCENWPCRLCGFGFCDCCINCLYQIICFPCYSCCRPFDWLCTQASNLFFYYLAVVCVAGVVVFLFDPNL